VSFWRPWPDYPDLTRWDLFAETLGSWFGYPHRHKWQQQSYPHRGWDGSVFYLRECTKCRRTKPYR